MASLNVIDEVIIHIIHFQTSLPANYIHTVWCIFLFFSFHTPGCLLNFVQICIDDSYFCFLALGTMNLHYELCCHNQCVKIYTYQ